MKVLVRDAELSVEQIAQTLRDVESILTLADSRALNLSEPIRQILRDLHDGLEIAHGNRGAGLIAQPVCLIVPNDG